MCCQMCSYVPSRRRVHSSCRKGSKMYTFDSITNSQRMLTEINKSGAIAKKKKIRVKSDTVKHLKAFRIISSEIPISLLILYYEILIICVFRKFFYLLSYELKVFFQLFVSKVYRVSCFEKY